MIPILYEKTEMAFKSNGLGRLPDCPRCEVTEERNGIYECEFDYPVTGVNFSEIEIGRIIAVTHGEAGDLQPFDIYRKTEPIDGIVTFYAQHVSYRMNGITLKPFTASSCADVFTKIPGSSIGSNPFSFWTNKAVSSDFKLEEPRTLRSLLAGEEGSILDVYGTGEYEFDKFNVKLYLHRGSDTDISIRYGKNLSDFESNTDAGDVYTAIVPFWSGTDEDDNPVLVTLPEWYTSSGEIAPGGREIIVPLDLSEVFEEAPTVTDLRDKATNRLTNSKAWLPVQNISVDFVQLWQTEEYKQFAPLQRLGLCDTCEIVVPMYGYSFRAKVIRTVWNVLLDRYDEMELGDKLTTFADTLVKPVEDAVGKLEKAIRTTKSTIEAALEQGIADAMEQIRGGMGGYIVQTVNAQGQPIELLVTDNLDLTQAVNIWRWNLGGLAHSSHGYNGPYDVAITQDGKINANMILSGTIAASLIAAHSISVSKLTGQISNGNWRIDLDAGTLTIGNISANNITTGTLSADRIGANSIGVGKLTGQISGGSGNSWTIDLTTGTITIGEISANKITSGTLDASDVNVTNLNADNITTGALSGANGNFVIDLDAGTITSDYFKINANGSARFSGSISGSSISGSSISGASISGSSISTSDLTIDGEDAFWASRTDLTNVRVLNYRDSNATISYEITTPLGTAYLNVYKSYPYRFLRGYASI